MARRDERAYPNGSVSEEQRRQTGFAAKTLPPSSRRAGLRRTSRAARLLPVARVGSALPARSGDAQASPPWPPAKSTAAGPLSIFRQALSQIRMTVREIMRASIFRNQPLGKGLACPGIGENHACPSVGRACLPVKNPIAEWLFHHTHNVHMFFHLDCQVLRRPVCRVQPKRHATSFTKSPAGTRPPYFWHP